LPDQPVQNFLFDHRLVHVRFTMRYLITCSRVTFRLVFVICAMAQSLMKYDV